MSKRQIWRKEQRNRNEGLSTPMPRDNYGARIMREKGWHDGEGLGAQSSGRTENIPIDPPWNRNKRSRGDEPVRFIPASTNSGCHRGSGSAYSPSFSDQQSPWFGSEAWDERLQEPSWFGSEAWDSMPSSGTTWGYQHDDDMRGFGEEDGQEADQQKPKKKNKKSANPGAHKRWLEAEMQPDDYAVLGSFLSVASWYRPSNQSQELFAKPLQPNLPLQNDHFGKSDV